MLSHITNGIGRRTAVASAIAFTFMLAIPLVPSSLGVGASTMGAAFAKHGADDGPNDNGHHVGKHHRHGNDDGPNHDVNDDHGGQKNGHK